MTDWQNPFMAEAIALAQRAGENGEVPVGAVVTHKEKVIARAHNETVARNDPTAHAEMLAIRAACETLQSNYLNDCALHVTLEPCPMCAQAIAFARIGTLVYGASDPKGGGVENGPMIFRQPTCHHRPEILSGIGAEQAGQILRAFFKAKR